MQASSISVRVSYLMLFMGEYCAKSKASIIIMAVKRRNESKQKRANNNDNNNSYHHQQRHRKRQASISIPSHPSIWRGKTHHFCIHNFILYLCIILFMWICWYCCVCVCCWCARVCSFVWQNCFPWLYMTESCCRTYILPHLHIKNIIFFFLVLVFFTFLFLKCACFRSMCVCVSVCYVMLKDSMA